MSATSLVLTLALFALPLQEVPAASPRLAAVMFAISNGFEIPRQNLVVANEVYFGGISDTKRIAGDRATTLPVEQTNRDSAAIARLLGAVVTTGSAAGLVSCPSAGACYSTTNAYVLVVDELKNNDPGIHIKLYKPASASGGRYVTYHAVVQTARSGQGWVATRYTYGPSEGIVR